MDKQKQTFSEGHEYTEFTRELEKNKLIYTLANEFDEVYENGHSSIAIIAVDDTFVQDNMLLSLLNVLSRKKNERSINTVFTVPLPVLNEKEKTGKDNPYLDTYKYYKNSVVSHLKFESDKEHDEDKYRDEIDNISTSYSQIIWSLPDIVNLRKNINKYSTVLDNVSLAFIAVPHKGIKQEEVQRIQDYLENFEIKVKGVIIEEHSI